MLRIEHLTKSYGKKTAASDISLHIQRGEIYGFIGHNGAGKTTVIKSCCGLLSFEEGDVFIDGVSIKSDPIQCKKKLAYLPDNPDLYEYLTGIKFLNFVADVYGVSKEDRKSRTDKYAEMLGLSNELGRPVSSYSHGMKQKLAVISALIHNPQLVIMDEPFVGLDPVAAHQLKELMKGICREGGAIFFSTHVLEVAEKLCDKVAVIKSGRIIADGRMDDIKGDSSLEDVFLELAEVKEGEENV